MKTKTINTYQFDELSDEAKQHAIEKLSDINVNYEWWDIDGLLDLTQKEITSRHIKMSKEWYKISPHANIKGEYPAYTGLISYKIKYFDLDRDQYVQFEDIKINDDDTFRKFLRIPKRLWNNCYYSFTNKRNYHTNTEFVIEPQDQYNDFTPAQQKIIDRAIDIMTDKISEALSMLRADYEHAISEEAIIETIKINEYEFDENGDFA